MEKYRVFAAIVTHTYISVDDFGGKLYELDKMTYTIGNFGQFCINAYLKICRNREIENDLIQAKSQKSPLCAGRTQNRQAPGRKGSTKHDVAHVTATFCKIYFGVLKLIHTATRSYSSIWRHPAASLCRSNFIGDTS